MDRKYVIAILQLSKEGGDIDRSRVGIFVHIAVGDIIPGGEIRGIAIGYLFAVEIGHESVIVAKGQ